MSSQHTPGQHHHDWCDWQVFIVPEGTFSMESHLFDLFLDGLHKKLQADNVLKGAAIGLGGDRFNGYVLDVTCTIEETTIYWAVNLACVYLADALEYLGQGRRGVARVEAIPQPKD